MTQIFLGVGLSHEITSVEAINAFKRIHRVLSKIHVVDSSVGMAVKIMPAEAEADDDNEAATQIISGVVLETADNEDEINFLISSLKPNVMPQTLYYSSAEGETATLFILSAPCREVDYDEVIRICQRQIEISVQRWNVKIAAVVCRLKGKVIIYGFDLSGNLKPESRGREVLNRLQGRLPYFSKLQFQSTYCRIKEI